MTPNDQQGYGYNNYNSYNDNGYNGYNDYNSNGYNGYNSYDLYSQDEKEISNEAYNLIIGGVLLYGFLINCFMVTFCFDSVVNLISNPIIFYLTYFAMVIVGSLMISKSANPVISFIGYNLIVVPLGMVLSLLLNTYAMAGYSSTITAAFGITAIVTFAIMFISSIFPSFFLSIGRTMGITLLVTFVIELVMVFLGFPLAIIDYIVVFIFCGYIGYDWARANANKKTVDNAIDSASELYIDIVNLFIRILRILARSQNN